MLNLRGGNIDITELHDIMCRLFKKFVWFDFGAARRMFWFPTYCFFNVLLQRTAYVEILLQRSKNVGFYLLRLLRRGNWLISMVFSFILVKDFYKSYPYIFTALYLLLLSHHNLTHLTFLHLQLTSYYQTHILYHGYSSNH